MTFEAFVRRDGVRLRAALVAAYGPDAGVDAASEALAYGWEHWEKLGTMDNPVGYLYRVGQTAARRARRPHGFLPVPAEHELPEFEPRLLPALERLSESQRVSVVLVHGFGWSRTDVAKVLGVSSSTIRTHIARALEHLQQALEVSRHAD